MAAGANAVKAPECITSFPVNLKEVALGMCNPVCQTVSLFATCGRKIIGIFRALNVRP